MLRVALITDSLSLPRSAPEPCLYEDTYPYLLKNYFFSKVEFIHIGRGGLTLRQLWENEISYWKIVEFDFVFLQSGIVDCAPRTLSQGELFFAMRIPFLMNIIKKNASLIRKLRKKQYLPLNKYKEYLNFFKNQYGNSLYFINIINPPFGYERNLPGITENISLYNQAAKNCEIKNISTDTIDENDLMMDFHHLKASGHYKLFSLIRDIVEPNVK